MKHSYATLEAKKLVPADNNPQHMAPATYAALKAAINEDDGLLDDPVVWKDGKKYRIVSGHHRVKALAEAGKPIHCKVINDPQADELWYRRRVLSANRVHGEPEDEVLRRYLLETFAVVDIKPHDFFVDLGFSAQEVQAYLNTDDVLDLARQSAEPQPTAADGSIALPSGIKQVSIFIPVADYPVFMHKCAELMAKNKSLASITEVVLFAIDGAMKA